METANTTHRDIYFTDVCDYTDSAGNISFKMTELYTRSPSKQKKKPLEELFSDVTMRDKYFVLANRMRKEEIMTDIVLVVEEKKFPAHKFVLAANSDYFLTLFNGPLATTENLMHMQDISSDVIENILNYLYTGTVYISENNIYDILDASCFFLLKSLRARCVRFLKERLDLDNCLQLFSVGKKFSLTNLVNASLEFIAAIFMEISSHPHFQYLSVDELIDIVSLENLDVSCEDYVLETVLAWVNDDPESRKKCLSSILKIIHLPFVSDILLQHILDTNTIIQDTWEAVEVLKLALSLTRTYWSGENYEYDVAQSWCVPRKCIQGIPSIIALGGPSFQLFNSELNQWCEITKCKPRHCAGMDVIGSNIYVVGGSLEWKRKSSGERYDSEKKMWFPIANMSTTRSNFGLLHLGGKLYACGGYDGDLPLRTAEMYDPELDKWTDINSMQYRRDGACNVTDNVSLYIIGGYDGSKYLKSVECYHPDTNTWNSDEIPAIAVYRQNATSAYLDSRIFVIGGYFDDTYHSSVEMLNLETNEWSFVSPIPTPRHHAGAAAMNGHIFVVGGWSGAKPVTSVDIYSVEQDTWRSAAPLPTPAMIRSTAINFPRKSMLSIFAPNDETTTVEGDKETNSISSLSISPPSISDNWSTDSIGSCP